VPFGARSAEHRLERGLDGDVREAESVVDETLRTHLLAREQQLVGGTAERECEHTFRHGERVGAVHPLGHGVHDPIGGRGRRAREIDRPRQRRVEEVAERRDLIVECDPRPVLAAGAETAREAEPGDRADPLHGAPVTHHDPGAEDHRARLVGGEHGRVLPAADDFGEESRTSTREFGEQLTGAVAVVSDR
jgi:hypothetical protein